MFYPRHDFPEEGIKRQNFPTRIRRHTHGVRAEDQPLDGHLPVELGAWPGEIVESRCLVIVVAPRGVQMDFKEACVVLDAPHGAHGEGGWPGGGGRAEVGKVVVMRWRWDENAMDFSSCYRWNRMA